MLAGSVLFYFECTFFNWLYPLVYMIEIIYLFLKYATIGVCQNKFM